MVVQCLLPYNYMNDSFEVVYGQKPPSVISDILGVSKFYIVDKTLIAREAILHSLEEILFMDQNHMKQQVDQGRSKR